MNIVFLQDDFPPMTFGGAGISTYEIAVRMKQLGHTVFVITTCREEQEAGVFEYDGLTVHRIWSNYSARWRAYVSLFNFSVVQQVEKILQDIKPDVVHINNVHFYLSYHCFKLAKRYAGAVVFTARDVMSFNYTKLATKQYLDNLDSRTSWRDHVSQARKQWNPFRNILIRRYLKYADKIFALSLSLKDALTKNGIPGAGVVYNGIDALEWHTPAKDIVDFKMRYKLEGKQVLLFSGRLSASKGGGKTIEALALASRSLPNVVLLVAGSVDDYARSMQAYADTLSVRDRIIFTGWLNREEMKVAYAAADVVLMPSICLDTFGRVNIEAMSSHKPVIGTRYGGTPEIVEDGVTGYIVNPMYPDEIAMRIVELITHPERAKKFGESGYLRVREHFDLDRTVQQYIGVYTEILNQKQQ